MGWALVAWSRTRQSLRALTRKDDGTYAAGHWFPINTCVVLPSAKPHCIVFGVKGEAYDFDLATDTFAPLPLHVVPPKPTPPAVSPAFIKLSNEVTQLEMQLPREEAVAIGERVMKRNGLTPEQRMALMKQECQAAIDKHKAEGTFTPPKNP